MTANVLPLRPGLETARVDPTTLPDPGPFVLADVRELIDRTGRSFAEIAACINAVCGITWLDAAFVEGWYSGEDIVVRHFRVLLWLAGCSLPSIVSTLLA